jgi:hypothetical protein
MGLLLTEDTFVSYAMKHYDKLHCTVEEFNDDLNRVKTIQRCLSKYEQSNEINERLVLNLILTVFNTFNEGAIDMLLFKVKQPHWQYVRPFLVMLNRDHELLSDVTMDMNIVEKLRKI